MATLNILLKYKVSISTILSSSVMSWNQQTQLCGAEARSHTRIPAAAAVVSTSADNDGEKDDGNVLHTEAERSAMKATVLEVVINLTKNGLLTARETNMANDMVLRENPVLVAAFKVRSLVFF